MYCINHKSPLNSYFLTITFPYFWAYPKLLRERFGEAPFGGHHGTGDEFRRGLHEDVALAFADPGHAGGYLT